MSFAHLSATLVGVTSTNDLRAVRGSGERAHLHTQNNPLPSARAGRQGASPLRGSLPSPLTAVLAAGMAPAMRGQGSPPPEPTTAATD